MKNKEKSRGSVLAVTAALLLISQTYAAPNTAPSSNKPVKCYGVNSCRGRGQCGGKTSHGCAGQNSCKGKAWIYMFPDQCQKKGGTVVK